MILLPILLWLANPALAAPQERYEAATAAAQQGDQASAAAALAAAVGEGGRHAAVYHALGNALYRERRLGPAIAAWRRGLALEPRNGDIAANLDRARRQATDRLDVPPPSYGPFFWQASLSARESALLASLALALPLWGLLLARLGKVWPRAAGLGARLAPLRGLGLASAGLGLLLVASTWMATRVTPGAVVVAPSVSARSALGPDGVELFVLHEGAEVRVAERGPDAALIVLPDERKGWVPQSALLDADPAAAWPAPDESRKSP